jgi:hypothetical protein
MNALEAIMVGLLTAGRQSVAWTAVPGAGRRAMARLAIAILIIGLGVAALDMATHGSDGRMAADPQAGTDASR